MRIEFNSVFEALPFERVSNLCRGRYSGDDDPRHVRNAGSSGGAPSSIHATVKPSLVCFEQFTANKKHVIPFSQAVS